MQFRRTWRPLFAALLLAASASAQTTKQLPNEFSFNHFAGKDTAKVFKKLFVSDVYGGKINLAYEFQPGWFATSVEGKKENSYGVLKGVRTLGEEWEITIGFRIGNSTGLVQNGTRWGLERDVWQDNDPKKGELLDFAFAGLTYLNGDLRAFLNLNGSIVGSTVTLPGTMEGYLRMSQTMSSLEVHAWAPGGSPQLVYMGTGAQPSQSNYSFGAAGLGAGTHILCTGMDASGEVNGTVETPAIEAVSQHHQELSALYDLLCGVDPNFFTLRGEIEDVRLAIVDTATQLPTNKTPGVQRTTQGNSARKQLKLASKELERVYRLLSFRDPDVESTKNLVRAALIDLELSKGALKGLSVKKPAQAAALQNNGF